MKRNISIIVSLVMGMALSAGCDKAKGESVKLVNMGITAVGQGETERAYSFFLRATRIDPNNHRAFYELALIDMYDNDREQKGIAHLESAEKLQPKDRDVLFQLGKALVTSGDTERGLRYLDRALEVDVNYAGAWHYKGVGLLRTGQYDEADKAFREAIACNPKYTRAFRELGEMYERFDHFDAAKTIYEAGLKHAVAQSDADLFNSLGMLAMQRDEVKEAIKQFDLARASGAGRTDVLFNLAGAFVADGDVRSAYRFLGEFINAAKATDAEKIKVATLIRTAMLKELRRLKTLKDQEKDKGDGAEGG